jgi:hypothetical protein
MTIFCVSSTADFFIVDHLNGFFGTACMLLVRILMHILHVLWPILMSATIHDKQPHIAV